MAKCDICNKGVTFGIQVSHSHRRSNRTWKPNVRRYPRYLILTICAFTLKCQSALFAERFSFTLIVCR